MSEEVQTVETLTTQALGMGLIKNKTEGKTLKKAGLLELIAKYQAAQLAAEEKEPDLLAQAKERAASEPSPMPPTASLTASHGVMKPYQGSKGRQLPCGPYEGYKRA